MNRDYDINKDIYSALNEMTMDELKVFFNQNVKGVDYAFTVIGNKKLVYVDMLKKLGEYKELTLEDIFGY